MNKKSTIVFAVKGNLSRRTKNEVETLKRIFLDNIEVNLIDISKPPVTAKETEKGCSLTMFIVDEFIDKGNVGRKTKND